MKNIKSFSAIALIFIFISALIKYIYFFAFGINIFNYISVGETFTLFDIITPIILLLIILTSFISLILDRKVKNLDQFNNTQIKQIEKYIPYHNKEGLFPRLYLHIKKNIKVLIFLALFIILRRCLIQSLTTIQKGLLNIIISFHIILIISNYLTTEIVDRISRIYKISLAKTEGILELIPLLLTIYTTYCIILINMIYWKPDKTTTLYSKENNLIVTSNDTLKYLGKTEKYYFFRDIKNNTSYIFKDDNVGELVIKQIEYNK